MQDDPLNLVHSHVHRRAILLELYPTRCILEENCPLLMLCGWLLIWQRGPSYLFHDEIRVLCSVNLLTTLEVADWYL